MTFTEKAQAEIILRSATRLFAALGYDGTSTRQIAEAAGFNIATVNYHVGSKRDLYLAVMERAAQAERIALESALLGFGDTAPERAVDRGHAALDAYLDFCVENPEIPALWMHRWLADAADITELEKKHVQPLITTMIEALRPGVGSGHIDASVDLEFACWTVIWCINAFCQSGVLDEEGRRVGREDPVRLRRFRRHLHWLGDRQLGLAGRTS